MSILCSNYYQLNVLFWHTVGVCVTRMRVWSHSWSLHGTYTHVYYLSQPPLEEGAADPSGVHRHQFGENPLRVPMLQVCIRWPLSWPEMVSFCLWEELNDMYEVFNNWIRRSSDNGARLGGVFCGPFAVVGQQIIQGITRNIATVGNYLILEICEKTLIYWFIACTRSWALG